MAHDVAYSGSYETLTATSEDRISYSRMFTRSSNVGLFYAYTKFKL